MKRSLPELVLLLLVTTCAPALGAGTTIADLPGIAPLQYTREADTPPVITADGSVVLAVQQMATEIDIVRIAPGSQEAQLVLAIPTAAGPAESLGPAPLQGPSVRLALTAAGEGFLLSRIELSAEREYHATTELRRTLDWFATPAGPGTRIGECEGGCGRCYGALQVLAADATHALISSSACTAGGQMQVVVRNLATGQEQPLNAPWQPAFSGSLGRPGNDIEGRFVAGTGGVMDWTTGQVLHQVEGLQSPGLLADGTVFYETWNSLRPLRLGPDDANPAANPISGYLQGVAGDVVLTRSMRTLSAWTPDGALLGTLNPPSFIERFAFDGRRVVYTERACMIVRVQQWLVGGPAPENPGIACGRVVPVGPVVVGPRLARLRVACPGTQHLGCVGQIYAEGPARRARPRFALRAGEDRWVTLGSGLGPKSCRALARSPSWSIVVGADTVSVADVGRTVVARVNACATP
ncbi:MAG: hypothetical protein JWM73_2453 [Solirubrobacterales bacterium]|nr:hypothetical protein [Solirubrobacterales bacterium]